MLVSCCVYVWGRGMGGACLVWGVHGRCAWVCRCLCVLRCLCAWSDGVGVAAADGVCLRRSCGGAGCLQSCRGLPADNALGEGGGRAMAEALRVNTTLERLDLGGKCGI